MQVKPLKYKNMTAGLDDSNLHKWNGMNFPGKREKYVKTGRFCYAFLP